MSWYSLLGIAVTAWFAASLVVAVVLAAAASRRRRMRSRRLAQVISLLPAAPAGAARSRATG